LDSKFKLKLKLEVSFYGLNLRSYPTLTLVYNTVIHLKLRRTQTKYLRWHSKLGFSVRVTHLRSTFNLYNVKLFLVDAHHGWPNHGCFAVQYDDMINFSHYNLRGVTTLKQPNDNFFHSLTFTEFYLSMYTIWETLLHKKA
jgi:hypothetical protein